MNPRICRGWRFNNAVSFNWDDCVQGVPGDQHYTVYGVPRHIGVTLRCRKCGSEFAFSAAEQKTWYEKYRFWIDSVPVECVRCRSKTRDLVALHKRLSRVLAVEPKGKREFNERAVILQAFIDSGVEIGTKLRQKFRMALKRSDHPDSNRLLAAIKTPN